MNKKEMQDAVDDVTVGDNENMNVVEDSATDVNDGSNSKVNFLKHRNIKTTLIILVLIVSSLSATYAYLSINSTNTTSSTQAGCFVVNYTGQAINNGALQSTNDYTKGEVSEIVLSKNDTCEIYTEASIYMHTNAADTDAPLENGALKYRIMNENIEISSGVIEAVSDGNEDQLLAEHLELTTTDTTYKVYLWIDSDISKGSYNGRTYSGYLYANSTQSSTIVE